MAEKIRLEDRECPLSATLGLVGEWWTLLILHDAFDGYPYSRLNAIRITSAKLSRDRAEIVADITGAYRPALGVERLERRFTWADGVWTTADRLQASKPVALTAQVHGDTTIEQVSEQKYVVAGRPTALQVEFKTPAAKAVIEPGFVVAAGPPGNVDKGPRVQRGTVIRASLPASKDTTLITMMKF